MLLLAIADRLIALFVAHVRASVMGNQLYSCGCHAGSLDPHQLLCRRTCGAGDVEEEVSCDPAGAVFDDTSRHLGELEQLAFRFAGTPNLAALRWLFVFGASPEVCDANG